MSKLTTIQPKRLRRIHTHPEHVPSDFVPASRIQETGVNRLGPRRHARFGEGRLRDAVVAGQEVEVDVVADGGFEGVGREDEARADGDGVGCGGEGQRGG